MLSFFITFFLSVLVVQSLPLHSGDQAGIQQALLRNAICGSKDLLYDHFLGKCIDVAHNPSDWNCAFLEKRYDPLRNACVDTSTKSSLVAKVCRDSGLLFDAVKDICFNASDRPSPENCAFVGMAYSHVSGTCSTALVNSVLTKRNRFENTIQSRNCYNQAGGNCTPQQSSQNAWSDEIILVLYDEAFDDITIKPPVEIRIPENATVQQVLDLLVQQLQILEPTRTFDMNVLQLWSANPDNSELAHLTPSNAAINDLSVYSLDSIFLVKGTATPELPTLPRVLPIAPVN